MANTKIEWADKVWNPVNGCRRVSEGCRNCYAEMYSARFSGPGLPFEGLAKFTSKGPRWTGAIKEREHKLSEPMSWRQPRRIFVNSMSDLFHEGVSDQFIGKVFSVMARCPQHTFMILTKRPERMCKWFQTEESFIAADICMGEGAFWPLENVWIGVSVEDQDTADERIPWLIGTPAVKHFISAEPLLEDVNLTLIPCPISGEHRGWSCSDCPICYEDPTLCRNGYFNSLEEGVDWVIVGCETGHRSRPMNEDWVRELRNQCHQSNTSFFYKQAKDKNGKKQKLPLLDGEQYAEFPERGYGSIRK